MIRSHGRMRADHHVRRRSVTLTSGAFVAIAVGVVADTMWLLGGGAWLLIAAILLELVYRP